MLVGPNPLAPKAASKRRKLVLHPKRSGSRSLPARFVGGVSILVFGARVCIRFDILAIAKLLKLRWSALKSDRRTCGAIAQGEGTPH